MPAKMVNAASVDRFHALLTNHIEYESIGALKDDAESVLCSNMLELLTYYNINHTQRHLLAAIKNN